MNAGQCKAMISNVEKLDVAIATVEAVAINLSDAEVTRNPVLIEVQVASLKAALRTLNDYRRISGPECLGQATSEYQA